ncbi:MAG: hypothetical protein C4324_06010 [Blastocatellia bacterium]
MKRIQDKVKDIVTVRKCLVIQDFSGDPAQTLESYHFTDATSELMTKWLDRAAGMYDGRGSTVALAGYRGVGKSHFMAVFAALTGSPELRTKVSDSHVAAGAQGLLRRRYPIIQVRRGTEPTLLDEVRTAFASALGVPPAEIQADVNTILQAGRRKFGDMPIILLIDTAIERIERVSRNDGPLLAEIAEVARELNYFVGVALDDDIAGADGTNSAIVRTYSIDYLDQEHLYKVVDTYIFPKNQQKRALLHDIYEYFREVIPTFRWSEQKFTALYPLHPAILEVAPFVRLYIHDFALLGFASEAGERILGRPANSLIALDEVFDSAEAGLRKIADLSEAFEAYDRLNSDVVAKIPVMQRLQAKLVLKALLLLSLDGQGATSGEISSGMLIFDENDPQKAKKTVEELVRTFAAALPDDVRVYAEEGREVRYGLRVSSKDQLNKELDRAAAKVSDDAARTMLHRLFHERFSDSTFFGLDGAHKNVMECSLVWRGGVRRGRVVWSADGNSASATESSLHDWEVVIDLSDKEPEPADPSALTPRAFWKPTQLTNNEKLALKRFYVLNADADFREKFGEQIRPTLHSHLVLADRIFSRVFLEDARIVIDGFDYNFTEEARGAATLSEVFGFTLEPLFEVRYPKHPYFLHRLTTGEVSAIVSDLYSGARQRHAEVQQLAQTFALPLGLVRLREGVYLPESAEELLKLDYVRKVMELLEESGDAVPLREVYAALRIPPFGLVREAQQLVLSAMVAQRLIEFVTSKGDRINHRSLDLKIIWDDIVGLSRPQEVSYSTERLIRWAAKFVGDSGFTSFENSENISALESALDAWLAEWDEAATIDRFSALPPELLNTHSWRLASRVRTTLGAASDAVRQCLSKKIGFEECIGRISDLFLDDEKRFEAAAADLNKLAGFVHGFEQRVWIREYLAISDITSDEEIETLREALLWTLDRLDSTLDETLCREIGYLWAKFHREYTEYFAATHDSVMLSHSLQTIADEFLHSGEWWEYSSLIQPAGYANTRAGEIARLRERIGELNCPADVREHLKLRPFCRCSFRPSDLEAWESLVEDLRNAVLESLATFRRYLSADAVRLMAEIEKIVKTDKSSGAKSAAAELKAKLMDHDAVTGFPESERRLLLSAILSLQEADSGIVASSVGEMPRKTFRGVGSKVDLALELDQEKVSVI